MLESRHYRRAMYMITDVLEGMEEEVCEAMLATLYEEDRKDVDLAVVLAGAILMYIEYTGIDGPEDGLKRLIELLDPVTPETAKALTNNVKDVMKNPSKLVAFIDEL